MKDNDLLVTELYHDPSNDAITALSVYLTPKTSKHIEFLTSLLLPDIKKNELFLTSLLFFCAQVLVGTG